MKHYLAVAIEVEVHDPAEFWETARARFEQDMGSSYSLDEFVETYGPQDDPNLGPCAMMIFDPGTSPPGCTILESSAG